MAQETEDAGEGHALLNVKLSEPTALSMPENWVARKEGTSLAFYNPEYPEVVNAWERKHRLSKGSTETINHVFSLGTVAEKGGKKTGIQAITRIPTPDVSALEAAARAGVRVEKPLAVFFDGRNLPVSVFAHVEGTTLDKFLEQHPATTEDNRKKRVAALNAALAELGKLHGLKMGHGDANANNFIVSPEGITMIDLLPQWMVEMARKGKVSSQVLKRLASKPHVEDCSRLYASLRNSLTKEEQALFGGKINDSAVKFHATQQATIRYGRHNYTR
ncbi:MAG: hypothetical protein WCX64_06700 [Candidatus Micrarchaeia archaeon]